VKVITLIAVSERDNQRHEALICLIREELTAFTPAKIYKLVLLKRN